MVKLCKKKEESWHVMYFYPLGDVMGLQQNFTIKTFNYLFFVPLTCQHVRQSARRALDIESIFSLLQKIKHCFFALFVSLLRKKRLLRKWKIQSKIKQPTTHCDLWHEKKHPVKNYGQCPMLRRRKEMSLTIEKKTVRVRRGQDLVCIRCEW